MSEPEKAVVFDMIDELGLCVFHREKWKGDEHPKWTVRKEDRHGNTLAQVRHAELGMAVLSVSVLVNPAAAAEKADEDLPPPVTE